MRGTAEIPVLSIRAVHDIAIRGAYQEVAQALARMPTSRRLSDPVAIALRALKSVGDGDVPGATALLRRAIDNSDPETTQYLADIYVPLLLMRAEFGAAEEALAFEGEIVSELASGILALRAQLCAYRGRDEESKELAAEAVAAARSLDNPVLLARVLQRVAVAAYYREDYAQAQERGLEAARLFERIDSHRNAALAYSLLYTIATDYAGTPDIARFYAQRVAMRARLAGDASLENYGVVGQLEIAAQTGDAKRVVSLRTRLLANPLHEQYHERFLFVVADTLSNGWIGNFEVGRKLLTSARAAENRTLPERALCNALLAVTALSTWHVDEARRYARLAISETAHLRGEHEPVFDARRRRTARLLAAAACVAIGDPSRARRALSKPFDPDRNLISLLTPTGIAEEHVPPLIRGYARFLNAACEVAKRHKPQLGLTSAELAVLRVLPEGMTVAAIASAFGRSPKTIEAQVSSIYAKLNVSNRAQAIQRARDLGLHA